MKPTYEELEAKCQLQKDKLEAINKLMGVIESAGDLAKDGIENLEQQLSESRREFWAADATINNLELKLAEMAEQLANAENKCAALATELEASGKLIDTLRQDKDKVIDMSIERVNKLLSRAEAAEKRIAELESLAAPKLTQQAPVVPDEMTPKQASRSYCGEVRGYRDGWNACRSAMLQCSEPETDNTNQQFESLSRGGK